MATPSAEPQRKLLTTELNGLQDVNTIIDGSRDRNNVIPFAVREYINGLKGVAYPPEIGKTKFGPDLPKLQEKFSERADSVAPFVVKIIGEINDRADIRGSEEFQFEVLRDKELWLDTNEDEPLFGVLACVDKGIPYEAVVGVDGVMGRTLGGDLEFEYIGPKDKFNLSESALTKRLIHLSRQGNRDLVEPIIEHTGCGRRKQILGNEFDSPDVPSYSFVFEDIQALKSEFAGEEPGILEKLGIVKGIWDKNIDSENSKITTTDEGLYAGMVTKIAQRQAMGEIKVPEPGKPINLYSPLEIYNKEDGDLIVGAEALDNLTDSRVIDAGGYTKEVLQTLCEEGKIFSFRSYNEELGKVLNQMEGVPNLGDYRYEDLQKEWLPVQSELINVTAALWNLYDNNGPDNVVVKMVDAYLEKALYHAEVKRTHREAEIRQKYAGNEKRIEKELAEIEIPKNVKNRLIHHLFHTYAYTHLLDTLSINPETNELVRGNVPGHHIETYLATGDNESGIREEVGLGQGNIERPSASEMFTGYSVLLGSKPVKEANRPIPVIMKVDTDRTGQSSITNPETNAGFADIREFLKLWPYFMVGELIPILAIKNHQTEGISRLGLSVVLSFTDMVNLLTSKKRSLPTFVPANTSGGKVVLVPAAEILELGQKTESLIEFRAGMPAIADKYSNPDVQAKIRAA